MQINQKPTSNNRTNSPYLKMHVTTNQRAIILLTNKLGFELLDPVVYYRYILWTM